MTARNRSAITLGLIVACASFAQRAAVAGEAQSSAAPGAEYAVRWLPAEGGPGDIDAVHSILAGKPPSKKKKVATYSIVYGKSEARTDLPTGFKAILRRRLSDATYEFTYKLRGPEAGSNALPALPRCEGPHAEIASEIDVSVGASAASSHRVFSRGCSIESESNAMPSDFPGRFSEPACEITMHRREVPVKQLKSLGRVDANSSDVKIEEWMFADGKRLLEVSWKAPDDRTSLEWFQALAARVLDGATGSVTEDSKEAMSQACAQRNGP